MSDIKTDLTFVVVIYCATISVVCVGFIVAVTVL